MAKETITVNLPGIDKRAISIAQGLIKAGVVFTGANGPITMRPGDVGEADIRGEARRILGGTTDAQRETAVYQCFESAMVIMDQAQTLAAVLLEVQSGLKTAEGQLDVLLPTMKKMEQELERLQKKTP